MTRVGVVGKPGDIRRVLSLTHLLRGVWGVRLEYTHEHEILNLVNSVAGQVEGLLFCSPISYRAVEKLLPQDLPVSVVPYDRSTLLTCLQQVAERLDTLSVRLSIDGLQKDYVAQAMRDVGLQGREIFVIGEEHVPPSEELLDFHYRLWHKGQTQAAITHFTSVANELRARKVPVVYVSNE